MEALVSHVFYLKAFGKRIFEFENIIAAIQLYNKKYHQKFNHS